VQHWQPREGSRAFSHLARTVESHNAIASFFKRLCVSPRAAPCIEDASTGRNVGQEPGPKVAHIGANRLLEVRAGIRIVEADRHQKAFAA
jgi:hypothetical protein